MNCPTLPPFVLDLEHATDHCDVVLTNYTDNTAFKGCLVLGLVVSTYELGKHNPSSQSLSVCACPTISPLTGENHTIITPTQACPSLSQSLAGILLLAFSI